MPKNLKGHIEEYLAWLESRNSSEHTVRMYRHHLSRLERAFAGRKTETIVSKELRGFIAHLASDGISRTTLIHYRAVVRAFWKWLRLFQYVEQNIALDVSSVRPQRQLP